VTRREERSAIVRTAVRGGTMTTVRGDVGTTARTGRRVTAEMIATGDVMTTTTPGLGIETTAHRVTIETSDVGMMVLRAEIVNAGIALM